jgi:hypothetical protein
MTKPFKAEAVLEEYKTLRTEILQHSDIAEKNIIACITVTGVALTFGLKESKPSILLLSCVLPIYFWLQHRSHRVSVAKLAAYISVFLENDESGLFWETRVRDGRLRLPVSRTPYRLRSFFHPYPILLATSILLTFWQFKTLYSPGPFGFRATLFFVFVFVATIVVSKTADASYDTLTKKWRSAFLALKSAESDRA